MKLCIYLHHLAIFRFGSQRIGQPAVISQNPPSLTNRQLLCCLWNSVENICRQTYWEHKYRCWLPPRRPLRVCASLRKPKPSSRIDLRSPNLIYTCVLILMFSSCSPLTSKLLNTLTLLSKLEQQNDARRSVVVTWQSKCKQFQPWPSKTLPTGQMAPCIAIMLLLLQLLLLLHTTNTNNNNNN